MKIILATFIALFSVSCVDAAAWMSNIVECSRVKTAPNITIQVCATTSFSSPAVGQGADGKPMAVGGYRSSYVMTTGVKKGVDISSLSKNDQAKAYKNGVAVEVSLDDAEVCSVTVTVKGAPTVCKSCTYCGDFKFTTDCTNVANGRKTKCEWGTQSMDAGKVKVFFPLKKTALSASVKSAAKSAIVKTPVAAPIKRKPTK